MSTAGAPKQAAGPSSPPLGNRPRPRVLSLQGVAEWLVLAWVIWWSFAYVQSALAQRFPHWFGWTTRLW